MSCSRVPALLASVALTILPACSTASLVLVRSVPEGARIHVDGVDTGKVTPAEIDLEAYSPHPEEPMRVEVALAGYQPTISTAYPEQHRCGQVVCEHKRRRHLDCRLPLFRSGGGVRVEIHYEYAYEVSFDQGPWTRIDGPSLWKEDSAGTTFALAPGKHAMRYRTVDPNLRRSRPDGEKVVEVPERGYVAFSLFWSP